MSALHQWLAFAGPENTRIYITKCLFCGDEKRITVDLFDLGQYSNGVFLQDAFPNLDIDDRERLLTGTCPKCWDEMYGEAG